MTKVTSLGNESVQPGFKCLYQELIQLNSRLKQLLKTFIQITNDSSGKPFDSNQLKKPLSGTQVCSQLLKSQTYYAYGTRTVLMLDNRMP